MLEFLKSGGPVMIPILIASVIGLAAFVERLVALRASRVAPKQVRIELLELARQARWSDGVTLCRKQDLPITRVAEVVFTHREQSRGQIKELAEELGKREAAELERYSGIVGIVASVAPLLGLLGTVWGMITAFMEFEAKANPAVSELAPGIYRALVTTMLGLTVAVPAFASFAIFRNRIDELVAEASLTAEHVFADYRRDQARRERSRAKQERAVEQSPPRVQSVTMERGAQT